MKMRPYIVVPPPVVGAFLAVVVAVRLFPSLVYAAVRSLVWVAWALFGAYHLVWTTLELSALTILGAFELFVNARTSFDRPSALHNLVKRLNDAKSYEEYHRVCAEIDNFQELEDWKWSTEGFDEQEHLMFTTEQMKQLQDRNDHHQLMYMLSAVMKRNHCGIDDPMLHEVCFAGSKASVNEFLEQASRSLIYLRYLPQSVLDRSQKLSFFHKASLSLGQTALCLSGGGCLAMYHLGVIKTLIEEGLYQHIHIISGASGGSLVAAMCAIKTQKEIIDNVAVDEVCTDYGRDGRMARENLHWFPPLWQQFMNLISTGYLVDKAKWECTCKFYYGDITFAEAYELTHKHVCISVSASKSDTSKTPEKLLLNHISTPHVLIRSAVVASCALPGILPPVKLLSKDPSGNVIPFEIDGVEWIDGSMQADIPVGRISELFSASNFIVSQVNFFVVPFLSKYSTAGIRLRLLVQRNSIKDQLNALREVLYSDLRHRLHVLFRLGMLRSLSRILKQQLTGSVTIVPSFSMALEKCGLQAIIGPNEQDMRRYIRGGQLATWRNISYIKHLLSLESVCNTCIEGLLLEAEAECSIAVSHANTDADTGPGSPRRRSSGRMTTMHSMSQARAVRPRLTAADLVVGHDSINLDDCESTSGPFRSRNAHLSPLPDPRRSMHRPVSAPLSPSKPNVFYLKGAAPVDMWVKRVNEKMSCLLVKT